MRIVVQRVKDASCIVNGNLISSIKHGLLLYIGFQAGDESLDLDYFAKKIYKLRIFEDQSGKMNRNLTDIDGEILAISQFTLYGDVRDGNRPSFTKAMSFIPANELYLDFVEKLNALVPTKKGIFGADMKINYINDGPVTLIIDSNDFSH